MPDPITPLTPAQTQVEEHAAAHDGYILRVLVALDEFGNAIIGGANDETISTDAALADRKHRFLGRAVSHILDFVQKDHGADAAAGDYARAENEAARLANSGLIQPK